MEALTPSLTYIIVIVLLFFFFVLVLRWVLGTEHIIKQMKINNQLLTKIAEKQGILNEKDVKQMNKIIGTL